MKTYNHAFAFLFAVEGSKHEEGEDITQEQMLAAIQKAIDEAVKSNALMERVGEPVDTFEE